MTDKGDETKLVLVMDDIDGSLFTNRLVRETFSIQLEK